MVDLAGVMVAAWSGGEFWGVMIPCGAGADTVPRTDVEVCAKRIRYHCHGMCL